MVSRPRLESMGVSSPEESWPMSVLSPEPGVRETQVVQERDAAAGAGCETEMEEKAKGGESSGMMKSRYHSSQVRRESIL